MSLDFDFVWTNVTNQWSCQKKKLSQKWKKTQKTRLCRRNLKHFINRKGMCLHSTKFYWALLELSNILSKWLSQLCNWSIFFYQNLLKFQSHIQYNMAPSASALFNVFLPIIRFLLAESMRFQFWNHFSNSSCWNSQSNQESGQGSAIHSTWVKNEMWNFLSDQVIRIASTESLILW